MGNNKLFTGKVRCIQSQPGHMRPSNETGIWEGVFEVYVEEPQQPKPTKYTFTHNPTTNEITVKNKSTKQVGTAKLNPESNDTFNLGFGFELAKARADSDKKLAWKLVNSTYKYKGEKAEEVVEVKKEEVKKEFKYKIGEKVKLKDSLIIGKYYGDMEFYEYMLKEVGESKIIKGYSLGGNYLLDIGIRESCYYPEEMLEPYVETVREIKVGDIVSWDSEDKKSNMFFHAIYRFLTKTNQSKF